MSTDSRDFFISYNQADKGWAEWIAWQLEDAGYTTKIQEWDFRAGGNFVLEMDRAAKTTRRTIAVLSPDYLAAKFTQAEWAAAFGRDPTGVERALLPVRVADCRPEGLLATTIYVDLVGLDEPTAKQKLLIQVSEQRPKPVASPVYPGRSAQGTAAAPDFPGLPPPLRAFREALLAAQGVGQEIGGVTQTAATSAAPTAASSGALPHALPESTLQQILCHSPRSFEEYRLARIAEWSQARYALDKRFTRLTLLLDQGPDAQATRWQAQPKSFDDLREVLGEANETALVLLGPPGCGKSTLLRRLELDLALDALRAGENEAPRFSFFVQLSRYRPLRPGEPLPTPHEWLAREWSRQQPHLPALAELLASRQLVLLLDAVNEIPHTDEADYRERIALWRDFLAELAHSAAGTRALFSCRSLDYSASLSTPELPVPHVRIEALSDAQVEQFLTLYSADRGPALWRQLRSTPQLDLFRSPFYLRLLLAQVGNGQPALSGRAALFSGFVRQALAREIEAGNPLFRPGGLLDRRDHERVIQHAWRNANDLPERGPLLPALTRLAHALQARRAPGQASRVRAPYDDALALLAGQCAADILLLRAGVALQVLEVQFEDVLYVHQLLQEYFAARALAGKAQPELVASAWRADAISPSLAEVLAGLAVADPLPEAPTTGWEETFVLAAALAPHAEDFVTALIAVNLPLAGRCAAQPDVAVSPALRERLQQALVERSSDPAADLRARIAAARALGELGDPRFERHPGPHGDYRLPPVVAIEGGTYPIGSDEGIDPDEAPAHSVNLNAFHLARFPVTNAEWRLFIAAGGYDDERWWENEAAQRWRSGEGAAEGMKQQQRDARESIHGNPEEYRQMVDDGRVTPLAAAKWEESLAMSDAEFEALLDEKIPSGRQTEPRYWNDPAYNDAAQPVVGICWYEARAYCAWLSAQSGQFWRLPNEAEWEAAARGVVGRRYAWGDDFDPTFCNTFESHVHGTTPVGVFPGGDTPGGVLDLCGNVWEWTSSAYHPYPYAPDALDEDPDVAAARRVLRGGSWYDNRDGARCACRDHYDPGVRYGDVGLRLVCVSPILKRCPLDL